MAGVGNRLEQGYIRRPNDGNVLVGVVEKIHHLLDQEESQINEIKTSDQLFFNAKWKNP